jgi:hypothetical protein
MATEGEDRDISDGYRRKSFEEHFRPVKNESNYSDLIQKDKPDPVHEKREEKPKKGKNIVELLTGDDDIGEFARKLNLDPEMAEKMLIPLLSLLDKYGVGESISASPKMESATNAFEIIRDVAPVVKGAADFISGRKAELEATDLAFLEQIKEAQGVADAALFDDDDEELFSVGESIEVDDTPAPAPAPQIDFTGFREKDWGDFFLEASGADKNEDYYLNNELTDSLTQQLDAVNSWAAQESVELREEQKKKEEGFGLSLDLGADLNLADTFAEGMVTDFAIIDVASLAAESGLSVNDVMEGDSQRKINNETEEEYNTEPIDLTEFAEPEKEVDYTQFDIPKDAEDYDPLHISDYDLPGFDIYDIQEVIAETKKEEEDTDANEENGEVEG